MVELDIVSLRDPGLIVVLAGDSDRPPARHETRRKRRAALDRRIGLLNGELAAPAKLASIEATLAADREATGIGDGIVVGAVRGVDDLVELLARGPSGSAYDVQVGPHGVLIVFWHD